MRLTGNIRLTVKTGTVGLGKISGKSVNYQSAIRLVGSLQLKQPSRMGY
jgi:hypothetical protein